MPSWPEPDAVAPDAAESAAGPESPEQRAARLQAEAILVDGHSDIPSVVLGGSLDLADPGREPTPTELARMKAAGITGEFFSIHVGTSSWQKPTPLGGGAARRALDLVDATHRQIERRGGAFLLVRRAVDVRRAKREGRIAAIMGIEGGHAIENSLSALRAFYRLGVRYMTLTHTTTNDWADSAGGALEPGILRHRGLAPFGEEVVREMQRIGMIVDVSHASDSTMRAVMKVAKAPVIASSSIRAAAQQRRDLDDSLLHALAENGGVAMVNVWALFLDEAYAEQSERFLQKHGARLRELGEKYQGDPRGLREEIDALRAQEGPIKPPPLSRIADHIDRVVKVAGVDHVGIGSSFGGVDVREEGLAAIEGLPNITLELVRRGYSDEDIRKLLGGNFLRVFEQVEAHAASTETVLSGDGSTRQLTAAELPAPPEPPPAPQRPWQPPPPEQRPILPAPLPPAPRPPPTPAQGGAPPAVDLRLER
ncbi:dipeptidase [Sorangium cellulosum]|uniref:Dipeptidase n=2 Tax=Sorangium cellulosum TaxID=56 RepID=A0A2L0ETZ9_SORCE|nr:dipeptidase [Sorangium cellulosum]